MTATRAVPPAQGSKDKVLGRIHTALAGGSRDRVQVPRAYGTSGALPAGAPELVERFADRLRDYRATVIRCGADGLADALVEATAGVRSVVVPAGLVQAWRDALTDASVPVHVDGSPRALDHAELDRVPAVVTACRIAIADTGTIVLDAAPDQGRRVVTLLPDRHVCVVAASQVVGGVPDAVTVLAEHPERPLTWISGPSATSDIELVRVEGVHGPRDLRVIIVDDVQAGPRTAGNS